MSESTIRRGPEHDISTKRAGYHVWRGGLTPLDPIVLTVKVGIATVQDYLTPDQADELGGALKAHAYAAREDLAAEGTEG